MIQTEMPTAKRLRLRQSIEKAASLFFNSKSSYRDIQGFTGLYSVCFS